MNSPEFSATGISLLTHAMREELQATHDLTKVDATDASGRAARTVWGIRVRALLTSATTLTTDTLNKLRLHAMSKLLVIQFAAALATRLAEAEAKRLENGREADDWTSRDWEQSCQRQLRQNIRRGDSPLDVAAYAAFCWWHNWPTFEDEVALCHLYAAEALFDSGATWDSVNKVWNNAPVSSRLDLADKTLRSNGWRWTGNAWQKSELTVDALSLASEVLNSLGWRWTGNKWAKTVQDTSAPQTQEDLLGQIQQESHARARRGDLADKTLRSQGWRWTGEKWFKSDASQHSEEVLNSLGYRWNGEKWAKVAAPRPTEYVRHSLKAESTLGTDPIPRPTQAEHDAALAQALRESIERSESADVSPEYRVVNVEALLRRTREICKAKYPVNDEPLAHSAAREYFDRAVLRELRAGLSKGGKVLPDVCDALWNILLATNAMFGPAK